MKCSRWRSRPLFTGVTVGGSGSGRLPAPVVIITVILVIMAGVTVYHNIKTSTGGPPKTPPIPYKCVNCGYETDYTYEDMASMPPPDPSLVQPSGAYMPMGKCPQCGMVRMAQAVKCPQCGTIYVLPNSLLPHGAKTSAKCPQCGGNPPRPNGEPEAQPQSAPATR